MSYDTDPLDSRVPVPGEINVSAVLEKREASDILHVMNQDSNSPSDSRNPIDETVTTMRCQI
jgi:hypothetical protein